MWLTLILRNWQLVIVGLLTCALALSIAHGKHLNNKIDKLTETLIYERASFATQVKLAKEKSDETIHEYTLAAKSIEAKHTEALKTTQMEAWKNYMARYGMGSSACSKPNGLRYPNETGMRGTLPNTNTGGSEDESSTTSNEISGEQLVIEAAARDALRLNEWIELCTMNKCEVVN